MRNHSIMEAKGEPVENLYDRAYALDLLKQYNEEPFHLQHGLTVGAVMRWFALDLGYGGEADYWETVGILHDIDYELYPQTHLQNTPAMLADAGYGEDFIHAVVSHGYGHCTEVAPEREMEKVLFAVDELTGLIGAAALMRPSKSAKDMEVKSLKKKYKDKKFAAGCSREVIDEGAALLGWERDVLFEKTIQAMRESEDAIAGYLAAQGE